MNSSLAPYEKSEKIAGLLQGVSVYEITRVVEAMPLSDGVVEAIEWMKDLGFKVGVISDGYTLATDLVARKLKLEFHVANVLHQKEGIVTGGISMPMGWKRIGCDCRQSVCKRYALTQLAKESGVGIENTVAVGDSPADLCMLKCAGLGMWYSHDRRASRTVIGKRIIRFTDMREVPSSVMKAVKAGKTPTP